MLKINLSFAKIVATPTSASWSQAYNAGNFFVVLALTNPSEEDDGILTNLGKQVINNLEAEFFGLETKNIDTIKQAVLTSVTDFPPAITFSLALAYLKDNILYVLVYGAGNVLMKRENKTGTLLNREKHERNIISASGYIKQGDIILLRTSQFVELIPQKILNNALDLALPNDMAETLTPHVHNSEMGGAACIIISITGVPAELLELRQGEQEPAVNEDTAEIDTLADAAHQTTFIKPPSVPRKRLSLITLTFALRRNKKRLILFILAGFILILLITKVYSTIKERQQEVYQQKFVVLYESLNEKYKEAMDIKTLNPGRSAEIFKNTKADLEKNLNSFPQESSQRNELLKLQAKIKEQLDNPVRDKTLKADKADPQDSMMLKIFMENKNTVSVTEDKNFVYSLTKEALTAVDKSSNTKTELIKNEDDWKDASAVGVYSGNLYVLDRENGIIKYVVAEGGYGKKDYFTDAKPDLQNAVSLAIDGSIWVLTADGKISKYTKGVQDAFEIKGLDGFIKPSQILTSQDSSYLYVLDKGAGRIVQIQKDGVVKTAYRAEVLKDTQAISISKDEKSIYALKGGKIWLLNL